MDKKVLVALKGLQFTIGDIEEQRLETIVPAQYYKKNDSHYLIYDEVMEGFDDTTRNMIKFRDSLVEVTKKGLINVHMVFEENKMNITNYATPFGDIMIGIDTSEIQVQEQEDKISINVSYSLEANYEHMADCRFEIKITDRGGTCLEL